MALMADDLRHLPFAVGLSRKTRGGIRQNLWLSLGMVAFLVPATILDLGIGSAVTLHEGSTCLVFNALRLRMYQDRTVRANDAMILMSAIPLPNFDCGSTSPIHTILNYVLGYFP